MKFTGKSIALSRKAAIVGLVAAVGVFSMATPAQARWYDGHYWHRGHVPAHGWVWDPRLGYYVAAPPVVVAQPAPVVVPPGAVIVQQPAPPPVVVAQPAPVVVEPAPAAVVAPVGVNLGVHIR